MLVHQLPPHPSNLRVRTWRRLQELGAVAVKQSVYVLPDTAESREDFEWLKVEIEGAGGEAIVYSADHVDPAAETALIEQFRHVRQQAYTELASELQRIQRAARVSTGTLRPTSRSRALSRAVCRDRARGFLRQRRPRSRRDVACRPGSGGSVGGQGEGPTARRRPQPIPVQYDGRLWVTRPRPGVDRMASAWLIRRFIDSNARFGFITDVKTRRRCPSLRHVRRRFRPRGRSLHLRDARRSALASRDPAVARIAEIVHDLDLKDGKFGAPEAATLGIAIDGLQLSSIDDGIAAGSRHDALRSPLSVVRPIDATLTPAPGRDPEAQRQPPQVDRPRFERRTGGPRQGSC